MIYEYKNDNCDYIVLPEYIIADEDDIMFIVANIFKTVKPFLTEKEFDIVYRRFTGNETLREIGSVHNVSGNRISQIEYRSIRKLQHPECVKLIRDFYR